MADYKLATNQWIKDNITPGYPIPKDENTKLPTRSDIITRSNALITLLDSYYIDSCVLQKDLRVGDVTKSISFTFYNAGGINMDSLELRAYNYNTGTYYYLLSENPRDSTGSTDYSIYAPLLGGGYQLQVYAKASWGNRKDPCYWYDNYLYTDDREIGHYLVGKGATHTFTGMEYDDWVMKTTICRFTLRRD